MAPPELPGGVGLVHARPERRSVGSSRAARECGLSFSKQALLPPAAGRCPALHHGQRALRGDSWFKMEPNISEGTALWFTPTHLEA